MKTCEHFEDQFSERFDGDLAAAEQQAFDSHVKSCASCQSNWRDYQAAVGMLRVSGHATTSEELVAATMLGVDAATLPVKQPTRTLPLLFAAFIGAAAALLLAWLLLDSTANKQPDATVVERIVEVPVDRIVEVRVEVPVDRIVKVPVEVIVQVPVIVERGRLFAIDTSSLAMALGNASRELRTGMLALANASRAFSRPTAAPRPLQQPTVAHAERGSAQSEAANARPAASALRVNRTDDMLQLQTSGTIEELVPTLLAQLTTPDAELCSMIERRLTAIHEEALLDPDIGTSLAALPNPQDQRVLGGHALFGRSDATVEATSRAQLWAAWWQANSALISQSSSL